MIWKLVLRQIGKHWRGLSVILLIWIGAGYYIFNYQHQALTVLSGWFVSLPAPGTQDPAAAYKLVKAAEERLKQGHVGLWCLRLASPNIRNENLRHHRPKAVY